jgi:hypothetical protein
MGYDRKLSTNFMADLQSGILLPLLNRVREDETLMLAIRENYINIYYRGGSLYKICQNVDRTSYTAEFNEKYNKKLNQLPIEFPFVLNDAEQVSALVEAIPELKYRMDNFLQINGKSEREFQQLVVRENNYSSDTHYFIVDIEIPSESGDARYDMLAVRWLSHERGRPGTLVPALIEMKYGTGALDGSSGLKKHMDDAWALIRNEAQWGDRLTGLEAQLNQLDELGLLTFNRSARVKRLEIDRDASPELIFLLAGYNPGSNKLMKFLNSINATEAESSGLNLWFFDAAFAGYAMYREAMLNLKEFTIEVSRLFELASRIRKSEPELAPAENRD